MKTLQDYKKEFKQNFESKSDKELIKAFNEEVGNKGWASVRGAYLEALKLELLERNFDCSEFIRDNTISLKHKIKLEGNKLKIIVPSV